MRVKKRDGSIVGWNQRKIVRAILGAFQEVVPEDIPDVTTIVSYVQGSIEQSLDDTVLDVVDIETIQDMVESTLMDSGHHEVAKAYILYRDRRTRERKKRLTPDPDAVADYIHIAKYAKHDDTLGRREVYSETVDRVKAMHRIRFSAEYERDEIFRNRFERAFQFVHDKRILPSMRSMQFGGAGVEAHNARMYNCAFTLIDRPRVFQEIFYLLLAGCGVGYSVQWHHVEKLPALAFIDRSKVYHHIAEDTIEGWGDTVGALIKSFIEGYYIQFGYHKIRPEGAPLKISGGLAPGHIPLRETLINITGILKKAEGRQLRPIECHDIICFIAEGVLSGGIRRSSLISLFSPEDTEMMYCKTSGTFDPSGMNAQRMMANNSAVLLRNTTDRTVFDRIIRTAQSNYGEPGFFFTSDLDYGTNPCGEIGLHPVIDCVEGLPITFDANWQDVAPQDHSKQTGFSFCNLCEINAAKIEVPEDYMEAAELASFLGTLQATYSHFPYLGKVTEAIAARDRLLGVGMTGMCDCAHIVFDPMYQRAAARKVVHVNIDTANVLNINPAQRATTVKPSGTASLELGCVGSGCHDHHARRYFRRITANKNEPPAQFFIKHNPHMVERKPNGDLSLVFPVEAPEGVETVKTRKAMDFLELVLSTYVNWICPGTPRHDHSPGLTHNVSCTLTVRDDELDEIIDKIWKRQDDIAAMSFVPPSLDKKYPFAPREAIETAKDKDRWDNIISNYRKVDWSTMKEDARTVTRRTLEAACSGGTCDLDF